MARPGASGASPGSRGGASSKKTEKGTKARIQKTEGKKVSLRERQRNTCMSFVLTPVSYTNFTLLVKKKKKNS